MRFLDPMKKKNLNVVKYWPPRGKDKNDKDSEAHEDMKWEICKQLAKEGKHYITEAIFLNGQRADILVLDDLKIVEILGSETPEQCKKKVESYPEGLEIVMVDANAEFTKELIY